MSDKKVTFGTTSKGKQSVIHKQYEYVKHREYVNGTIQWRCKMYQKYKYQARITTKNDEVVGDFSPEHNHDGNKETILARQAVAAMKDRMGELSATPTSAIGTVSTQLSPSVLMALPKRTSLKRTLQRKRHEPQSNSGSGSFPAPPTDTLFTIPQDFRSMVLHDSGVGPDRLLIMGSTELLDGLARAKLWLADGTFKVVPSIFFQLYSIHFELVPGINPAAIYCLVQTKTRAVYDRILDAVKHMIPLAAPERILLDFENAAIGAFQSSFPTATVMGCYFHLTQSVIRKVQEIGLKADYENDDDLRIAIRCSPALAMVPASDVVESFLILSDHMPNHEKIPELLSYFEHTYIRGRRRPGRVERYGPAIFPIPTWNHFETASDGVARTTNAVEGWHYGLQALFQCHHPTLWSFMQGIAKDVQMQKTLFLQGISGSQPCVPKRYRDHNQRVRNAVARYSSSEILLYLRSIAHLSFQ
jgi:hypothetical protein